MKQDAPALTNPNPMYMNLSEKEEEKVSGGGKIREKDDIILRY